MRIKKFKHTKLILRYNLKWKTMKRQYLNECLTKPNVSVLNLTSSNFPKETFIS